MSKRVKAGMKFSVLNGLVKLVFSTLLVVSSAGLMAQSVNDRPKLVVGIMVEGMQHQHVQQLWTRLHGGGFKRLTTSGASFRQLKSVTTSFGSASDITTLFTGTVPYYHGITANRVLNPSTSDVHSIFEDKRQSGIQSHLRLSGKAIEASTWVDELMMATRTRSKSFVVALHPEDALAMGGHTATGVVWLDDVMMRWGSTDYYTAGMPWQAAQMNTADAVSNLARQKWTPLYSPGTYLAALSNPSVKSFSYDPSDKQEGTASSPTLLKRTPVANSLVRELGLNLIREQELGKDSHTDALLLQFTVRTPVTSAFSLSSIEMEDMYLRLDAILEDLITKTESMVGDGNVLYVLYGSQSDSRSPSELQDFNFHTGYYNSYRSMALLNSYLIALYGQEKWVKSYYGRHIYLNRTIIEEKGHDFKAFQQLVADFVSEFEGVQSAWPLHNLVQLPVDTDSELARLRNSVNRKTAGDVVMILKPGWLETDDQNRTIGEAASLNTRFPLYLSGWKIETQTVRESYKLTDIAPTLAAILKLPAPNASIGDEIILTIKE